MKRNSTNDISVKNMIQQAECALLAFFLPLVILATIAAPLKARPLDDVIESKYIRIFVYENFEPYSYKGPDGKMTGIDVEIARRIAEEIGVELRLFVRGADESVDDDLRNNVWKGHYIGGGVADVMMHVPVDDELRKRNTLVVIFGRYYTERMALALDPKQVGDSETLAPFLQEKIGVELDTLADFYLSSPSTFNGRIRNNVVRYRVFHDAIEGLKKQEVAGLMGPRGQLEAAVKATKRDYNISSPPFRGMALPRWDIGMAVYAEDSRDLGYEVGDIVLKMRKSGEMKKIFAKYGLSYFSDFLD